MKLTTQQLADLLGGELKGKPDAVLDSVASLKNAGPADLTYAEEKFQDEPDRARRVASSSNREISLGRTSLS